MISHVKSELATEFESSECQNKYGNQEFMVELPTLFWESEDNLLLQIG